MRAATLTIHACRQTAVEPWGDRVTIERCEQRGRESPQRAAMEPYLDVDVTKAVRGVLSPA